MVVDLADAVASGDTFPLIYERFRSRSRPRPPTCSRRARNLLCRCRAWGVGAEIAAPRSVSSRGRQVSDVGVMRHRYASRPAGAGRGRERVIQELTRNTVSRPIIARGLEPSARRAEPGWQAAALAVCGCAGPR